MVILLLSQLSFWVPRLLAVRNKPKEDYNQMQSKNPNIDEWDVYMCVRETLCLSP